MKSKNVVLSMAAIGVVLLSLFGCGFVDEDQSGVTITGNNAAIAGVVVMGSPQGAARVAAPIAGRIAEGEVPQAVVRLLRDGALQDVDTTDAAGAFLFDSLDSGTYVAYASTADGSVVGRDTVVLSVDERRDIRLELNYGGVGGLWLDTLAMSASEENVESKLWFRVVADTTLLCGIRDSFFAVSAEGVSLRVETPWTDAESSQLSGSILHYVVEGILNSFRETSLGLVSLNFSGNGYKVTRDFQSWDTLAINRFGGDSESQLMESYPFRIGGKDSPVHIYRDSISVWESGVARPPSVEPPGLIGNASSQNFDATEERYGIIALDFVDESARYTAMTSTDGLSWSEPVEVPFELSGAFLANRREFLGISPIGQIHISSDLVFWRDEEPSLILSDTSINWGTVCPGDSTFLFVTDSAIAEYNSDTQSWKTARLAGMEDCVWFQGNYYLGNQSAVVRLEGW